MPRIKDQALCIRLIDWSETSQIVALLTEHHGKVRGLAKGAKRTSPSHTARFSGGFELLTEGEVVGIVRASDDLASLTEWDLQQPFPHLRRDLEAQQLALFAADLVHAVLADDDPHPAGFRALQSFWHALAEVEGRGRALLLFQWRLLDDTGYRPELDADVRTGQALPSVPRDTYRFDPAGGGLTDVAVSEDGQVWPVRAGTVGLLRELAETGLPGNDSDPTAIRRANRLLCSYTRHLLDRELPTMRFVLKD